MRNKLTSRKLWVAILGAIGGLVLALNGDVTEGTATIIASVLGYLLAEGYIDAKAVKEAEDVVEKVEDLLKESDN